MPEKRITRVEFPARTFFPEQPPPTKRVAAYARVSTMKDAQENSLQAQQEYFTEYIQRHPGWVFAGMYSDDGISGLSIRERDGFNSMVTDALDGKIDLILTKSLSRFARNTVDALTTIRSLKAAGVAVYFQKENINTMDSTGEFLITLMSSFAEEESRSISENVTWAVRHRYAQGIYHLPGLLLGYQRSPVGEIQVDEAGARVVRFIYLLALAGKSSTDICRILMDYGILSPGQSQRWEPHTVRSILKNEKYTPECPAARMPCFTPWRPRWIITAPTSATITAGSMWAFTPTKPRPAPETAGRTSSGCSPTVVPEKLITSSQSPYPAFPGIP